MLLRRISLLLLLPLAIAACDSQQPSYSASGSSAQPQPAAPPAQPAMPAPPPAVADDSAAAAPVDASPPRHVAVERPPESRPVTLASMASTQKAPESHPIEPIGVGGCDNYVARYRACIDSLGKGGNASNAERFAMMRTLTSQTRQWRADVSAGNTGALVTSCSNADKEARAAWARLGCTSF